MINKYKSVGIICIIAFIVSVIDTGLVDVFLNEQSWVTQSIYDFFIVITTGAIGLFFAKKINLPIWWDDKENNWKQRYIILGGVGLLIIIANTVVNISMFANYKEQYLTMEPWMEGLTPFTAVLISLRAAFTEEIIYRFCIISVTVWFLSIFISSRKVCLITGILLSSVMFVLIHSTPLIPFIFGLMLSYVYIRYGLIPVFTIHFVADLIPFILFPIL